MTTRFDLNILPINHQMGKTVSKLPGLLTASPPRRSPRRRTQEKLLLHLRLEGNAPLSDTAMGQLLTKLAEVYYETEGSTTSALRNVTDVLNKYLLDRNYRAASRGLKAVGYLTQVVLREDRILYAQCGPTYIYHVTPETVVDLHDPDLSGAGLGLGKSFKVRYHQIYLQQNQILILAAEKPPTWTENLFKTLPRLKFGALIRRLLHKIEGNLEAVVLFPLEGESQLKVIEPIWAADGRIINLPDLEDTAVETRQQERTVERVVEAEQAPAPVIEEPAVELKEEKDLPPLDIPEVAGAIATPPLDNEKLVSVEEKNPDLAAQVAVGIAPKLEEIQASKIWGKLGEISGQAGNQIKKAWHGLLGLISRTLPDDQVLDLPSWTLSLIAILVPLLMVIIGSVFYIRRGRNHLYEDHFSQAQTLMALALTQLDSPDYYQTISEAMQEVQEARSYQQTEEVEELFSSLRLELDTLDRITRLEYQPLFSRGLGVDVTISEIVVTAWNDLYMLNADKGTVIWAQSNPDGYRIIDDFTCGPIEGHVTVGPLVDIAALPTSQQDQATILGIDENHTMIFCYADLSESPVIFEDTSYTLGRGPVKAITMASSAPYNLYILDPEKRAIWIEYQSQNYHEGSEYFGAIDSPEMADAVDLVTSGSELFILHQDGYITKCVTDRADSDPLCTTPFNFSDTRPGREPGPFIAGASFDSFTIKGSPGIALYMLDAEILALYRFSTQLELQEQFRPVEGIIDQPATAFTVTMSDRVFLGVDDQVYTAQLLP
ncbi:MAG TPA: hypothetical protein ENG59_00930 [Chloroflexi bacterium]|nr:hypothetical protein [Chloroflexota bacterium]